jgi:hypothetical protein
MLYWEEEKDDICSRRQGGQILRPEGDNNNTPPSKTRRLEAACLRADACSLMADDGSRENRALCEL